MPLLALLLLAVFNLGAAQPTCGPGLGNCASLGAGLCCSQFGYCGCVSAYCDSGCQTGYGVCGTANAFCPSLTSSSTATLTSTATASRTTTATPSVASTTTSSLTTTATRSGASTATASLTTTAANSVASTATASPTSTPVPAANATTTATASPTSTPVPAANATTTATASQSLIASSTQAQTPLAVPVTSPLPPITDSQAAAADVQLTCGVSNLPTLSESAFAAYITPYMNTIGGTVASEAFGQSNNPTFGLSNVSIGYSNSTSGSAAVARRRGLAGSAPSVSVGFRAHLRFPATAPDSQTIQHAALHAFAVPHVLSNVTTVLNTALAAANTSIVSNFQIQSLAIASGGTASPSPAPSAAPGGPDGASSSTSSSSPAASVGLIVGVVIAGVVVLALAVALLVILARRGSSKRTAAADAHDRDVAAVPPEEGAKP